MRTCACVLGIRMFWISVYMCVCFGCECVCVLDMNEYKCACFGYECVCERGERECVNGIVRYEWVWGGFVQ